MKKKLLLLFTVFITIVGVSQEQTITIGSSTSSSATRGPFQRSDSGSSSVFSRGNLVYSATELSSLTSTSTINKINFDLGSTNIIDATGDAILKIYMKNSSVTEATTIADWDTAIAGYTLVGTYTFNTTTNFPGVEGFLSFDLDTDFNYGGNALEVAIDWDCSGLTSTNADANLLLTGTGSLNWHWTATTHNSLTYSASSSVPSSTGNLKAQRANTQFVYTDPNATNELIIGTSTSSSATRGPFQRSDSGSGSVFSRGNLVYTAAELTSLGSGGAGGIISAIDFDLGSTNIIDATGNAILKIYMKNSSVTAATTIADWDVAIAGYTLVGTYTFNSTNNFPGAEGFLNFDLSSDFEYTGGTLEVAVDWDCSGLTSTNADANLLLTGTGSLNWHWTATTHNSLTYSASSSVPSSTGNLKAQRANTKFTFKSLRTSTWDGSAGNDWDTAANWSDEIVPTDLANVIVPAGLTNYPTATSAVMTKSINIASGASLIANMSVTGSITYNVNSGDTNWHFYGSPVKGETYDDNWITANNIASGANAANRGIATYNRVNSTWEYYQGGSAAGTFGDGIGYAFKGNAAGDYAFIGSYTALPVVTAITQEGSNNWNLVGNTTTAYLDVATYITENTTSISDAYKALYVFDGSDYSMITTGELAPGTGYFINAKVASGNISLSGNVLGHKGDAGTARSSESKINLIVSNGDLSKKTELSFDTDSTLGLDPGKDLGMFNALGSDLSIYTELVLNNEGISFGKQSVPANDETTISVGLIADAGQEIEISAESINLSSDIEVYLEDKTNDKLIDLSTSSYKITLTEASNGVGQFYLHTSSAKSLSTDAVIESLDGVGVYKSSNSQLTITGLSSEGIVRVYSLLGKNVVNTSVNSGTNIVNLPSLNTGVYIVKLQSDLGEVTRKIILE